jgi:hypothetical protein
MDANEKFMRIERKENVEYSPPDSRWPLRGMPRRVHVKGMQGVDATVIVTVVRDRVWLSISPPFTWEAIMEPAKVDELISTLELAQDEAKKKATTRNGSASITRSGGMSMALPLH